jgi:4-hydroxy-2-oxoheptanedioate aldolase
MSQRINRAIGLLAQNKAIFYAGAHTGHILTYAQGLQDAHTYADYLNIGMEHGSFDMAGLAEYLRGLVDGGPTATGHRTPAVIVEAPVNGTDEANVRANAWQFRQILGRGVHGIILCQDEDPEAVKAFVESCRYPFQTRGVDPSIPAPAERLAGAMPRTGRAGMLGVGLRGRGSERTAAAIWGVAERDYMLLADPWPLNPKGELLLGVKIESPEGVANCEAILATPGLGYAEMGPGDLGLSLGYLDLMRDPYPPEMQRARDRIFAACRKYGLAFLEGGKPESVTRLIDSGVRVIPGETEAMVAAGKRHQGR